VRLMDLRGAISFCTWDTEGNYMISLPKSPDLRRAFKFIVIALISASGCLHAQQKSKMSLEVVRYFPTSSAMLVEAFIEIPLRIMAFEKSEAESSGYHISFAVELYDKGNRKLYHDEWDREGRVVQRLISSRHAYIIEPIISVPLDVGGYELVAKVHDMVSGDVQEFKRAIDDPGESRILSDIVLANSIVKDTTKAAEKAGIFRKGGLRINVNSSGVFSEGSPLAYFYYQIRNDWDDARTFQVNMDILNTSGDVVKKLPARNLLVNPGLQADAAAFTCKGLPAGGYYLRMMMERPGSDGNAAPIVVTKSFTVAVREQVPPNRGKKEVSRNEFAGFSESQLDSVFSMMRYLLSNSQKKDYKKLNADGKRTYLHRVWKSLDPIPATEENEFREELADRFSYAQKEFHTVWAAKRGVETGWAVDYRGIIYIKYGKPDERLNRPNEYGSNPYEIWKYYSSGYAYLFVKSDATQGYDLIYTNNRVERSDPCWTDPCRFFDPRILQEIICELGNAVESRLRSRCSTPVSDWQLDLCEQKRCF